MYLIELVGDYYVISAYLLQKNLETFSLDASRYGDAGVVSASFYCPKSERIFWLDWLAMLSAWMPSCACTWSA